MIISLTFYSTVFEYEGSPRKVWWQFFGDNVGETVEIGNFDPKIATFWIDSGKLKGALLESGSPEHFRGLSFDTISSVGPNAVAVEELVTVREQLQKITKVQEMLLVQQPSPWFHHYQQQHVPPRYPQPSPWWQYQHPLPWFQFSQQS